MRERRHHDRRVGTADTISDWYEVQLAQLIADTGIGEGFELVQRIPVGRIRDALEQMDRRQTARDDAMTRREPHRLRGDMRNADGHPWCCLTSAALGVEVLAHHVEI